MTTSHTPGPWFIWKELAMQREGLNADEIECELLDYPDYDIYAGTPSECTRSRLNGHTAQICTVDAEDVDFDDDEELTKEVALANARLIAAAPELLDFAKEWLDRQGSDENYMVAKAREAIAKAEGKA